MKDFEISDHREADRIVHRIAADWRSAPLTEANQALCNYAWKLTTSPAKMAAEDLEALRERKFCEQAIHDATQVIGYFNYINRIADGLHVDQELDVHHWESSQP
ncbi:MAG TPA: hypothetical protein PKD64_13090 [Pirellulaceae bacterium]|nr:hypothetical protein [Pirellulaceae bacterium]HMO93122.1 hypothetical protein [Pirellulaceae bacterium]HMP70319.1 hypothetical protein [Pirellulaceae bacterium]